MRSTTNLRSDSWRRMLSIDRSRVPISCFFFFQAEDGIRDYKVTGVQTCALPISGPEAGVLGDRPARRLRALQRMPARNREESDAARVPDAAAARGRDRAAVPGEIGRASCRERV